MNSCRRMALVILIAIAAWMVLGDIAYGDDIGTRDQDNWATQLYDRSTRGNSCVSCDFLSYFSIAVSTFSKAAFVYFNNWFTTLVPTMLAIWIAWRVARLMITGGEDGRTMMYDIIKRLALFSILWSLLVAGTSAWHAVGPTWVGYAFQVAKEIRTVTVRHAPGANEIACQDELSLPGIPGAVSEIEAFVQATAGMGCVVERGHIIGIATGLAVVKSASAVEVSWWEVATGGGVAFIRAVILVITGLFLITVFAISMIYFIFLILDIVVKGMLTAAFLPVFAGMTLFQPTRGMAVNAAKNLAGALATSVGLAVVGVLSIYLITNVAVIYDNTWQSVAAEYRNGAQIVALPEGSDRYRAFVERIQQTGHNAAWIPMDIGTPWFLYLVFVGLSIYSLGRKIVTMIEAIIGAQGLDTMAQSALKIARTGVNYGMAGAGGMLMLGKTMASLGGPAAGAAAGFATQAAGNLGAQALGSATGTLGNLAQQVNPTGSAERDAKNSFLGKATDKIGAEVRSRADAATRDILSATPDVEPPAQQ